MRDVQVICPECGKSWVRKKTINDFEKDSIGASTSDFCPNCSLLAAFKKNPGKVTAEIRSRQRAEGNPQCFATNRRWKCGEVNCQWKFICNGDMVESVA